MPSEVVGTSGADRILVVDDQEANVRLLERILLQHDLGDVRTTTDPRRVEPMVHEERPDLLLLDLHMPHLDGFAILERLASFRREEGYLPVLVLTADVEPASRRRALELGASDFVTKPFDVAEVVLRCRNLLHTRRLYRTVAAQERKLAGELVAQAGALHDARSAHRLVLGALERLHDGASLEERAAALAEELSRTTEFSAVAVMALEPDGSSVPLAVSGTASFDRIVGRRIPATGLGDLRERLASGPIGGPVTAPDPQLRTLADEADIRSVWYAPIVEGDRIVGAMVAGSGRDPTAEVVGSGMRRITEYAAIARALLGEELRIRHDDAGVRANIESLLSARAFHPVFQPVVDLRAGHVIGFEALTRFDDGVRPDLRFAEAHRASLGVRLEEETLVAALAAADALPHAAWLSVNASPELLISEGRLARVLAGSRRIVVVEITEHVAIEDYTALRAALGRSGTNVRVAIDDAGAGFASFRHVLELRPDFVKLDADLVRGIDADPSRQALVVGMRYFAQKTGCTLIAEGIETETERAMLDNLDIRFGQGYLLGRPAPVSQLLESALR